MQNRVYDDIYQQIATRLRIERRRMLDIGCGNDLLSLFFKEKGWETTIIEPSRDAAEYLQKYGLTVYNQPVEAIGQLGLDGFSFINLQFVLEHLREPFRVLQALNRALLPGGVIRVCVPNDFSEGQLAYLEHFKEAPHWVCLPDHVNYFSFDSLSGLLRRAGFREVYRTTNFPLEFLLLGGMNYYAGEAERAKVGPFVRSFEASLRQTGRAELLRQFYESLAKMGLGRSIFMIAVKE